jgi:hypothetical protein
MIGAIGLCAEGIRSFAFASGVRSQPSAKPTQQVPIPWAWAESISIDAARQQSCGDMSSSVVALMMISTEAS